MFGSKRKLPLLKIAILRETLFCNLNSEHTENLKRKKNPDHRLSQNLSVITLIILYKISRSSVVGNKIEYFISIFKLNATLVEFKNARFTRITRTDLLKCFEFLK